MKQLPFYVECLEGLIGVARGDYDKVELIAVKLGGPLVKEHREDLKLAISMIKKYKYGIDFSSVDSFKSTGKEMVVAHAKAALNFGQEKAKQFIDKIDSPLVNDTTRELLKKAAENPSILYKPDLLFEHFVGTGENKLMSFDEFKKIFTELNLKVPHARIMKIFSQADKNKKGGLNYSDFCVALNLIKEEFVFEMMNQLNISIDDIIKAVIYTITMLLLLLIFIFVGIQAFSPSSPFSSVINSLLPVGAGIVSNRTNDKSEKTSEVTEIKKAVD